MTSTFLILRWERCREPEHLRACHTFDPIIPDIPYKYWDSSYRGETERVSRFALGPHTIHVPGIRRRGDRATERPLKLRAPQKETEIAQLQGEGIKCLARLGEVIEINSVKKLQDKFRRARNQVLFQLPLGLLRSLPLVPTPINFLHVGKCGGSETREFLAWLSGESKEIHFPLHIHNTQVSDLPKSHGYIINTREPVSRFVSQFYFRQEVRVRKKPLPEQKAFSQFSTPNELAEALSPSSPLFPDAVRVVESGGRPLTHQLGGHPEWRTEKAPLAVLCQHHLNEDLRFLAELVLGLSAGENLEKMPEPTHRLRQVYEKSQAVSEVGVQNLQGYFPGDFLIYEFLISHCVQQRRSELLAYIRPGSPLFRGVSKPVNY